MTVKGLVDKTGYTVVNLSEPEREISGAYMGDLLSWVMGRANADNVWITIMSNLNVVAVASLADVSCVILSEDVVLDNDALLAAKEKGINVLSSSKPSYETAVEISGFVR